jgi:hypothetical protein
MSSQFLTRSPKPDSMPLPSASKQSLGDSSLLLSFRAALETRPSASKACRGICSRFFAAGRATLCSDVFPFQELTPPNVSAALVAQLSADYFGTMRLFMPVLTAAMLVTAASAAPKPRVITFGRWTTVKLLSGPNEDQATEIKIRSLYVDAVLRAYTFGTPHEISDRLLVVERMLRVNDTLPSEAAQRWIWERGGWLVVDRTNGHISPVNLPEFDLDFSAANWYRDYVAYCGISADGRKLYAMVMQLGLRKPILKKPIGDIDDKNSPECSPPTWQRQPTRVTFLVKPDQRITYAVHGSAAALSEEDDEGTQ